MAPNNKPCLLAFLLLAAWLLTACQRSTVYFQCKDTAEGGWEKNDTLVFDTQPMSADATYQEEVALRISNNYPFMRLTLIVQQTVYPAGHTTTDTLDCHLYDDHGNVLGPGTGLHQFVFPLKPLSLHRGDSLHVTVHHDMKREILPGISSVGIKISR
jgi:gliding motility-associated lipoprotein GldH